jgi:DDE superfamily endonuclease
MTKEAYKSGRIRFAARDGNREFISLLAYACADGTSIPSALIYQGASGDLQDTWMHDLNKGEEAYFASVANGWSSDAFGLAWLNRFHENTCHKSSRRRLLIVDGHSSHVNWTFVSAAEELRILLLILPPHMTHWLQPLDVGLFSPLSQVYSSEMQEYTHRGQECVSMIKRMF